MKEQDFLKILEEMPLGLTCKLKIGENDYALEMIRKDPANKDATMEDLKQHNEEMRAWEKGYAAAIKKMKVWRNETYLQIKNLT